MTTATETTIRHADRIQAGIVHLVRALDSVGLAYMRRNNGSPTEAHVACSEALDHLMDAIDAINVAADHLRHDN